MGIKGLSSALSPYTVSTVVGCRTTGCGTCSSQDQHERTKIIIDGPAFAYCVYDKLIVNRPQPINAIDALPSYSEIGQWALTVLAELESYNVTIHRIYFDGYLPTRKREIRRQRLEDQLKRLYTYRLRHADDSKTFKRQGNSSNASKNTVPTSGSRSTTNCHELPVIPFLVPAVLDSLSGSRHARITRVVPGEADTYCAEEARENGGLILTNDSDLFVHDLGSDGAFTFLSQAELFQTEGGGVVEDSKACKPLELSIFRPNEIAKRLGLISLQRLAFLYQESWGITLSEAIAQAKNQSDDEKTPLYLDFLTEFTAEACIPTLQAFQASSRDEKLSSRGLVSFLDPRVSEFVLQLASKQQETANISPPILIDDINRSSAWLASATERSFAYSVGVCFCQNSVKVPTTVAMEYTRKGPYIVKQQVVLLSYTQLLDYGTLLLAQFRQLTNVFSAFPGGLLWRIYALAQTFRWYLDTGKTPPSRLAMMRAISGAPTENWQWEDYHLSAHIQAVLYSLRMVQQILAYTLSIAKTPEILSSLAVKLRDLPGLAHLIPSPLELAAQTEELDIGHLLDLLANFLQIEATSSVLDHSQINSPSTQAKPANKRKKAKKEAKLAQRAHVTREGVSGNM